MRKIIFRGKRKPSVMEDDSKTPFVYGDLMFESTADNKAYIICEGQTYEINEDTIGQFSGLYDRKGNMIYEGDILKCGDTKRLYVLKFWDGMFYASVEECNEGVYGGFPLHALTIDKGRFSCDIVGNIHDNKEFLKKDKNDEKNHVQ